MFIPEERGVCLKCTRQYRMTNAQFTLRPNNLKTQQSRVILDLCLKKTRTGKSHGYRESPFSKRSVFVTD